ncbi:MAG: glycosyltransferase family 2 protein [Candidatus Bathyarchaeia archaeon]
MVKILAGQVDVSIILCAYNEAHIIVDAIRNIERVMDGNGLEYEIILVDDGSFDGTRDKALEYSRVNCNGRLKVIGYERNMGKGHAIRVGFEHSSGDKVVFIDGDLDVSPNYIPHYVKALEHYDVVIGSKWHPKSKVKTTFKRRLLSFGFNVFSRMLTGIKLRDTQTGLKAFREVFWRGFFQRLW